MPRDQNIIMALLAVFSKHILGKGSQASFGAISAHSIAYFAACGNAKTRRRIITTIDDL
jgi:hypothetical protein